MYHIYNQGNNRQLIFFNRDNYLILLLKKMDVLKSYCDIFAYCLKPNHFHWLLKVKEYNTDNSNSGDVNPENPAKNHPLVRKITTLLSSYTQAINNQEK